VYREAKYRGFREGSIENERLQRMAIADAFVLALASLLPQTLFDSGLPAPYNWFKDIAALFFDDENQKRREGMFTGSTDILHEIAPPITRIGQGVVEMPDAFHELMTGNIHKLGGYTAWTLMPGGRMTRDVIRAYDNPSMAAEFMTGIPIHRVATLKAKVEKGRTEHSPRFNDPVTSLL
jgi:hypothetical protein